MATSSYSSSLFLFLILIILILIKFPHPTHQQQQQQQTPNDYNPNNTLPNEKTPHSFSLSPPPPSNTQKNTSSSFKPSTAVVIGVLTTMFSLTFLLLLYIKHCNSVSSNTTNTTTSNYNYSSGGTTYPRGGAPPLSGRKNSGIDRCVIESLPIFRFGSLTGQKDGLDCAVCLTKFESAEVLRLLPKCKHAFHVECVDTWLDAHSTCPLCRCRVDPEDILLLHDTTTKFSWQIQQDDLETGRRNSSSLIAETQTRRISGRHSSVEGGTERKTASFFRRSLDSATSRKKNENGVGCLVRGRKDGMLMLTEERERRLEHRIIVSASPNTKQEQQRWSDVQPLDLLYLTSEMIISGGGGGRRMRMKNISKKSTSGTNNDDEYGESEEDSWSGRKEINTRSVSEITGLSRFLNSNGNNNVEGDRVERRHCHQEQQRCREEGLVSRWLAWISSSKASQLHTQPAVR